MTAIHNLLSPVCARAQTFHVASGSYIYRYPDLGMSGHATLNRVTVLILQQFIYGLIMGAGL